MEKFEFLSKVNGVRWVDRGVSFDGMDCYGLVILYYRHVLGINLPLPDGYKNGKPTQDCWAKETVSGRWDECNSPARDGLVFTAYRGKTPLHVGIMIDKKMALHCRGDDSAPGKVEVHSIKAIESVYGKVTFHRYVGDKCQK